MSLTYLRRTVFERKCDFKLNRECNSCSNSKCPMNLFSLFIWKERKFVLGFCHVIWWFQLDFDRMILLHRSVEWIIHIKPCTFYYKKIMDGWEVKRIAGLHLLSMYILDFLANLMWKCCTKFDQHSHNNKNLFLNLLVHSCNLWFEIKIYSNA
jgi:hypothetical protein